MHTQPVHIQGVLEFIALLFYENDSKTWKKFDFSLNPYAAVGPTIESTISRAPINDDALTANSQIYSTYEPSSQIKYSPDKYLIAEKIQSVLRQQPAYAQVISTGNKILFDTQHIL